MSRTFLKTNLVAIVIIATTGFLYYNSHKACTSPITYKIGSFDTNFGISKEDFLRDVNQAGTLWSNAISRPLFAYNENGNITIDLVYDNRQKTTDQNAALQADSTKIAALAAGVKQQYQELQSKYAVEKDAYTSSVTAFNKAQQAYTTEVTYWNTHGGAPESEYNKLTEQRTKLTADQNLLESKRVEINNLVNQINAFIGKYNLLVSDANSRIQTINQNAGKEFEEGQYDPKTKTITIYEFSSDKKLLRVLAHEMGHALGIDHNTNPASIMYALNEAGNFELSKEDIAALKTVCHL